MNSAHLARENPLTESAPGVWTNETYDVLLHLWTEEEICGMRVVDTHGRVDAWRAFAHLGEASIQEIHPASFPSTVSQYSNPTRAPGAREPARPPFFCFAPP